MITHLEANRLSSHQLVKLPINLIWVFKNHKNLIMVMKRKRPINSLKKLGIKKRRKKNLRRNKMMRKSAKMK